MRDDSTRSLAFSPDGHSLAPVTGDLALKKNAVQLWDVTSGKVKHTVAAEQEKVIAAAFAPDGKILATVGVSDVRLWDVSTGRERSRMSWGLPPEQKRFRMSGGPSFGHAVAFSRDGETLVTWETYSGAIHLWDVATGALKPEPPGHTKEPAMLRFRQTDGALTTLRAATVRRSSLSPEVGTSPRSPSRAKDKSSFGTRLVMSALSRSVSRSRPFGTLR
jgi:WD40 repeat protein